MNTIIGCTVGLRMDHRNFKRPTLVRIEYYNTGDKVKLVAVNGHNLNQIRSMPSVEISHEEYINRTRSHYNDTVEALWAMELFGFYQSVSEA